MIFSLEINQTGVGFSSTISHGVERITGKECVSITESIKDAVYLSVDSGLINSSSIMIHMARGNGIICGKCNVNKTNKCSFKANFECYQRKESQ